MGKGGADGSGGETENLDPPTSPIHRQSSQSLANNAVPSSRVGEGPTINPDTTSLLYTCRSAHRSHQMSFNDYIRSFENKVCSRHSALSCCKVGTKDLMFRRDVLAC